MILSYKQLIQFIFPPSADEQLLMLATEKMFSDLRVQPHTLGYTLLPYREKMVRAAIHLAKFHHHERALTLLGITLAAYTKTHPTSLIIPVPLSTKRYRKRGYNQVVEIIKAAQKIDPTIHYNDRCLVRAKHTQPQTELDKESRLKNLDGAFAINLRHVPKNIAELRVVLLDDVLTTGTTMKAARTELIKCKPKSITCVALGH